MMMKEALTAADEVIDALKKHGLDYSAYRDTIAQEAFDEGLLEGNWDVTVTFDDPKLKDLRFIQEDEYDQHMDDDAPEHDDMVCYVGVIPAYVWLV